MIPCLWRFSPRPNRLGGWCPATARLALCRAGALACFGGRVGVLAGWVGPRQRPAAGSFGGLLDYPLWRCGALPGSGDFGDGPLNRRGVIASIGGLALPRARAAVAAKPRRLKPQLGDVLVHAFGEYAGTVMAPEQVADEPLFAFPMEPVSGLIRDGSLHNQVAVLRVEREALTAKALRHAVGGTGGVAFVVYSVACTHTGCEVSGWRGAARHLICPCHGSEFDVTDAARVVNGPAPKPLAMLPVELVSARFRVTGGFSRRVGPEPP